MVYRCLHRMPAGLQWPAWACCLALLGALAPPVRADVFGVVSLPLRGVRMRSGIRLEVDNQWLGGYGYRPVELRATAVGANRNGRKLTVHLYVRGWAGGLYEEQVTTEIEIPAGAQTARRIVNVLKRGEWQGVRVEVYEGRRRLDDLSMKDVWSGGAAALYYDRVTFPAVLVIDRDAPPLEKSAFKAVGFPTQTTYNLPDIGRLQGLMVENTEAFNQLQPIVVPEGGQPVADQVILSLLRTYPNIQLSPPSAVPADWRSLSQIDFFAMDLDEWLALTESAPDAARAIRDAVAMGANLLVWDAGTDGGRLDRLHDSLDLPRPVSGPVRQLWQVPAPEMYGHPYVGVYAGATVLPTMVPLAGPGATVGGPAGGEAGKGMAADPAGPAPFLLHALEMGRVVAIGADQPFAASDRLNWHWLSNCLAGGDEKRTPWCARHGVALDMPTSDFWAFLVPGVGTAPVKTFLAMIGLFALAIGPVNYWMLRRRQRLYLLLITVPLGAAVASLAMFAYALVAEGLDTRARVRSITYIDADGTARSWSRQAYYAGVAPSGGLRYPPGTLVYPIDDDPTDGDAGGSAGRSTHVRWDDDRLILASGYLSSRTLKQFLVLHQGQSEGQVLVREGQPPQATNRLGVPLRYLAIVDAQRRVWGAEGVEPGEEIELTEAVGSEWSRGVQQFVVLTQPAFPPGMDPATFNRPSVFNIGAWRAESPARLSEGLLETSIQKSLLWSTLPPGTFVALADTCPPTVPMGIRDASEAASLHVIRGAWK